MAHFSPLHCLKTQECCVQINTNNVLKHKFQFIYEMQATFFFSLGATTKKGKKKKRKKATGNHSSNFLKFTGSCWCLLHL